MIAKKTAFHVCRIESRHAGNKTGTLSNLVGRKVNSNRAHLLIKHRRSFSHNYLSSGTKGFAFGTRQPALIGLSDNEHRKQGSWSFAISARCAYMSRETESVCSELPVFDLASCNDVRIGLSVVVLNDCLT